MNAEETIKTTKPPKPTVTLTYNGTDCTKDFSKYLNSLTFNEFEDEQSDELSLTLNNNDGYFTDLWYPEKGDKLTCSINYGADTFECGTFTIDENSFDFSVSGDSVEIKALATSANFSVRTQKIKNRSGKTLTQIANEIGTSYGFKVLGEEGNVRIGTIVQKNESDIAFLKRIAREYGFIFNIKDCGAGAGGVDGTGGTANGYLTFINVEELENQDSLFTLSKTDLTHFSVTDTVTKIYGKCRVQYFDLKTKSLKSYTAVGNTEITDTLNLYKRCDSLENAQKYAQSALKNSYREIKGRIEIAKPINNFMAGVNFDLTGVGKFEGKYHIKSQSRRIDNSGYKTEGNIIKC